MMNVGEHGPELKDLPAGNVLSMAEVRAMENDTGKGTVRLGYPHGENVTHSWHASLERLRKYDRAHGRHLHDDPVDIKSHPIRLVQSRNMCVRLFLDDTDDDWLWLLDTDMGFEPDTLERLLQAADPAEAPVVGALCFAVYETVHDGYGGMRSRIVPTMYMMGHTVGTQQAKFCFYGPYPEDTVVQVAGTGCACLLVHRSVLEKVRAEYGDHWFDQVADATGDVIGEDLSFCLRAGALGVPMFVHTGVKTSHRKGFYVTEEDYQLQPLTRVDEDAPDLPVEIHLAASLASLNANQHVRVDGMLKLDADLDRYKSIIEATKPEVVVETGTRLGASARWFLSQPGVAEVITMDVMVINDSVTTDEPGKALTCVSGNSVDPDVAAYIGRLVGNRRCMVSLDSDHSAEHVGKEIDLYGPMVSKGCYLVVEDTIFGYAPPALRELHIPGQEGSPLDAVVEKLVDNPEWSRDLAVERMSPTSHHPAGWWVRNG